MNALQLILTIFIIKQCFCNETPKIYLKQGVLLGRVEKTVFKKEDYFSFRGIPYAEPPTGPLRFKPPKPHTGWKENLKAFKRKPTCMQLNTRGRLSERTGISGSEDCLYIDIFTPNMEGKAPVIVFEYNDNFRTWFNGTDTYSPDFFIEEGVIVVTISSRLGIFGYLTTEDNVMPGNNGLRDFILGLEWLKNNIEQFGGDASKITLMGSRGGATTTNILLYSEKAKGLFSGAIIQGGSSLESTYFVDKPRKKAFEIGKFLNLTVTNSLELFEGLQNVDANVIIKADVDLIMNLDVNDLKDSDKLLFIPTLEGEIEDAVIKTLPENGKVLNDVPVIIGFNSRAGIDSIVHNFFDPNSMSSKSGNKVFQLPIRTNFEFKENGKKYKEANKAVIEFYHKGTPPYYGNLMEHAVYVGDVLHVYPLALTAENLSKSLSSPVFFYLFDFRGLWNENSNEVGIYSRIPLGNTGALVLDELCYLLVCSRMKKTYKELIKLPSEQPEIKLMKKLVRLWSNFAKTGNPTPTEEDPVLKKFTWEPFNESESKYLHITKLLKIKTNPLGDRKQFWDDLLRKYSNEAVDGVIVGDEVEEEEEEIPTEDSKDKQETIEDFVAQNAPKEEGADDVLFVNNTHEEL
ncbi:unnamed protein product [Arctia plantaginis]|uniref:Carboxylesterase type B domain-containing protein n=1 Tax=Arctia plantaginis TaxID=874455 RepID=A0A8S0Z8K1_ARCPL|nr:unnamed protein product [Arctia plantaginis]